MNSVILRMGTPFLALTNLFGRFDESDYIFDTALRQAFAAEGA